MKKSIIFDPSVRPVYNHLVPIVNLLLNNGNESSHDYLWGEDRTGYFVHFKRPIDFGLIEASFEIPEFIRLDKSLDTIECDKSWVTIRGGVKESPSKIKKSNGLFGLFGKN